MVATVRESEVKEAVAEARVVALATAAVEVRVLECAEVRQVAEGQAVVGKAVVAFLEVVV